MNRAIKKHNSVTGSKIPINVCYSEYELTRQDERIIRQKMMGLTIRRGKFILEFD